MSKKLNNDIGKTVDSNYRSSVYDEADKISFSDYVLYSAFLVTLGFGVLVRTDVIKPRSPKISYDGVPTGYVADSVKIPTSRDIRSVKLIGPFDTLVHDDNRLFLKGNLEYVILSSEDLPKNSIRDNRTGIIFLSKDTVEYNK